MNWLGNIMDRINMNCTDMNTTVKTYCLNGFDLVVSLSHSYHKIVNLKYVLLIFKVKINVTR